MKNQKFRFKDMSGNIFIVYADDREEAKAEALSKSRCSFVYCAD